MTADEAKALWEKVKANSAALDACPGPHAFEDTTPGQPPSFGKRWRCQRCGGEADTIAKLWYERGLAHGRASGEGCAPDMARLLLDAEWSGGDVGGLTICPWCAARKYPEPSRHKPTCPFVELLSRAGLR
jgi:hypothetical protein